MKEQEFDFNLFKVFRAVYQTKNITRAAEQLGVSQPAVSNALSRLRKTLNDPLFVLVSKEMEPTEFAKKIANDILQGYELFNRSLQSTLNFNPKDSQQTFKLSMSEYSEVIVLPKLLRYLKEHAPSINLIVKHFPNDLRQKALEEGDSDLNIHGSIQGIHHQKYKGGVVQKFLFEDRYVMIFSENLVLEKKKLSIEEFAALPHAHFGAGVVDQVLLEHGLHRRIVLEVPHILVIPHIIANTNLVVTVPKRYTEFLHPANHFQVLEPPLSIPPVKFHMYWHEKKQNSPAHIWLRNTLAFLHNSIEEESSTISTNELDGLHYS